MKVVESPAALRQLCDDARKSGRRVGLVPTMGALHSGHLSLLDAAQREGADFVVATIFVNPLQFAAGEDLDKYPRPLEADLAKCREHGASAVFAPPDSAAMYPEGFGTSVRVTSVTQPFEGVFRPTHFDGVTTVVAKLFNLAGPCLAVFGRKDYQQWRVIARMAIDLDMPVDVVGEPIVREPDGLAMSSRNVYLSEEERHRALGLSRGLGLAEAAWAKGLRDPVALVEIAREPIESAFDRIDYVGAAHPDDLSEPTERPERLVLLAAAHLGHTRLIDNLELS